MVITRVGTPGLPTYWTGQVHSVFHNSCNIQIQHGPLVCLHRFDFGMLPHSLYVPDLSTQFFHPGQPVQASPVKVVIDDSICISWAEDVEVVGTQVEQGVLPCECDDEWQALNEVRQQQIETSEIVCQMYQTLSEHLHDLHDALFAEHSETLTDHCFACIGLGQGLTPSGDDMLLGTLAALHRYAPELAPRLSQAITPLLTRTNEISSSYLKLAMNGYFATPVLDVLYNLGNGWNQPTETLLSVGHSSGSDILYGILTTVKELWDKEKGRK